MLFSVSERSANILLPPFGQDDNTLVRPIKSKKARLKVLFLYQTGGLS